MRRQHANNTRRTGFTLIELMVTLAIVALMVLAAGRMLASARKAVTDSQTLIKANAQARTFAAKVQFAE